MRCAERARGAKLQDRELRFFACTPAHEGTTAGAWPKWQPRACKPQPARGKGQRPSADRDVRVPIRKRDGGSAENKGTSRGVRRGGARRGAEKGRVGDGDSGTGGHSTHTCRGRRVGRVGRQGLASVRVAKIGRGERDRSPQPPSRNGGGASRRLGTANEAKSAAPLGGRQVERETVSTSWKGGPGVYEPEDGGLRAKRERERVKNESQDGNARAGGEAGCGRRPVVGATRCCARSARRIGLAFAQTDRVARGVDRVRGTPQARPRGGETSRQGRHAAVSGTVGSAGL